MDLTEPRIIEIMRICDPRGKLAVVQPPATLPFEIARTYWLHDTPAGGGTSGCASYTSRQMLVALSGSFDVDVRWSGGIKRFTLSRADRGLYIPPMTWYEISNMSTNAVVFGVSSNLYSEVDFVRDFESFKKLINDEYA